MIRVTRSAIIDAPIERVWEVLRDFNPDVQGAFRGPPHPRNVGR